jgi:chemotaxis protein MotA
MNIAAIVGTIGLGLVSAAGMTEGFTNSSGLLDFFHPLSMMIVVGGVMVSAVYSGSFRSLNRLLTTIPDVFKSHPDRSVNTLVMLVDVAKIARKNVLAVENLLPKINSRFLKDGLHMVVDRVDRELVEKVLVSEMINLDQQRTADAKMVKLLSTLSPAWGMIGTLFGLVLLLKNLGAGMDVIGQNMSTAIITTLYGAVLSNGLFLPWYNRLIEIRDEERRFYQMAKDGILAVESNMRPELLEQDLKNYLIPELREKYEELKFARKRRKKITRTKAAA